MDFKTIKKEAIAGETVLVNRNAIERLFVGFNDSRVVTYELDQYDSWDEQDILNWTIKKPEEKLYQFIYESGNDIAISSIVSESLSAFQKKFSALKVIKMKQINLDEWSNV